MATTEGCYITGVSVFSHLESGTKIQVNLGWNLLDRVEDYLYLTVKKNVA